MKYHIIPDLMTLIFTLASAALIISSGLQTLGIHLAGGILLFGLLYVLLSLIHISFLDVNAKGLTIIMITHELEYLKYANRLIHVVDGEVVENYSTKNRVTKVEIGEESESGGNITLHDHEYAKKLNL